MKTKVKLSNLGSKNETNQTLCRGHVGAVTHTTFINLEWTEVRWTDWLLRKTFEGWSNAHKNRGFSDRLLRWTTQIGENPKGSCTHWRMNFVVSSTDSKRAICGPRQHGRSKLNGDKFQWCQGTLLVHYQKTDAGKKSSCFYGRWCWQLVRQFKIVANIRDVDILSVCVATAQVEHKCPHVGRYTLFIYGFYQLFQTARNEWGNS